MNINLEFDAQAQAAPQSFRQAIQAAANVLDATFVDSITLNLSVGYGEIQGSPELNGGASAGPNGGVYDSYSHVRTWLAQNASAEVQAGVAAVPTGTSIQGQSQVVVWRAEEKLMGDLSVSDPGLDGASGFATDIPTNLLEGVALHELTHAMGRVPYSTQPDVMELFRFTSPGVRYFYDGTPAAASYFSLDGGRTHLADYGQGSDPSDFLNSGAQGSSDPFNEFYSPGTAQALSSTDVLQMEALGFHTASAPWQPGVSTQPVADIHANNLMYASTASGYNHFIDLVNFEASQPDLIKAFGANQDGVETWYNAFEPIEHRVGTFNGLDYVASYSDLIKAYSGAGSLQQVQDAGAAHYVNIGVGENRSTTFNGLDYVASYKDLVQVFGANSDAGAIHFIEYGSSEHRTTTFDGLNYIASYSDLIKAFGTDEQAGAAHFIHFGAAEGRTTTFDGLSYIAQNSDLMKAFGANNDAGASHYINFGAGEGRSTSFNVAAYEQAHPDLMGRYASDGQFLTAYINTYAATGHALT